MPDPVIANLTLWPLAVYFTAIVVIIAGMISKGGAQVRFDIKFYLVAVVFLVFDLEAAFLYAWAVAVRESGWSGYVEVLVFVGVLAAALVYLWRLGVLD